MIEMKPLVIGDLTVEKPVIQGGMGVGISLHRLAGAVAKAGGVGLISAAQIGFTEPDFAENPEEANARAIHKELKLAREIAPKGVIGFNIMVATKHYDRWVKEAVKAGADQIDLHAGVQMFAETVPVRPALDCSACDGIDVKRDSGHVVFHYLFSFACVRMEAAASCLSVIIGRDHG